MTPSLLPSLFVLLTLVFQIYAWPTTSPYANIRTRADEIGSEYDYVIVGGGTSGLTVGDRLSEGGKYTVLVLEYGYFDTETGWVPRRIFNITSEPQPNLNNRSFPVVVGCVVGGSSCVNGQVFLRGTREEYDAWAELGGGKSSWNWEGLLPYFKKGITLNPPEENQAKEFNITYDMKYWGTTSKIYATFGRGILPAIIKILYSAMKNMPGMPVPIDSGAGESGLYWYSISQDATPAHLRSFSRTGHWDDINRPNYEILVGAKVNKLLFNGDSVTGVQFTSRNDSTIPPVTVTAKREVILAAGSIHTPQILMLSGIGPSPLLNTANIPVKIDLPGVGSNFQDHSWVPNIGFRWGKTPANPPINITQTDGGGGSPSLVSMVSLPVIAPERFDALADEYASQSPSTYLPSSYTSTQITGYTKQQELYSRLMRSPGVTFLEIMLRSAPGGAIQNLHPMSRGTVLLNVSNPQGEMVVDYRAATNPVDKKVMVENVRFMRRYMTRGEMKEYEAVETIPGMEVESDEDLLAWVTGQIIPSVYHPVGTCAKMPREWGGVVDEDLLVYGVQGLSIVDASIFPTLIGATTSMTVYAVAEKAADIIKLRTQEE